MVKCAVVFWVLLDTFTSMEFISFILDVCQDKLDQYLTQLLQSTTQKFHLPPIQRGQHHVFSAEHTTRDILSFMAQVQGLNVPREFFLHPLYAGLQMQLCSNCQNVDSEFHCTQLSSEREMTQFLLGCFTKKICIDIFKMDVEII